MCTASPEVPSSSVINNDPARFDADVRRIQSLYDKLRRKARELLSRERRDHTLQEDDLVHEALLRLRMGRSLDDGSESKLHAAAVHVMPQVLVEHARRRNAVKRVGKRNRVSLDHVPPRVDSTSVEEIDLLETLHRFSEIHPRQAKGVELFLFERRSVAEIASILKVSSQTIRTDLRFATAWLRDRLSLHGS